jgi:hypothetical protein
LTCANDPVIAAIALGLVLQQLYVMLCGAAA